jgi:TolB-like protein/DNA-binding winged helix-turn-helix (wHTH) protein/cytochrome c-type biogenesis protein CcmH/NrfG
LQVLALLLEHPGEVVTREQLIARLWPHTVVDFDMGLNTAVRKLRLALGDTADTPRYVQTLPRRGYRFVAPIDRSIRPSAVSPDATTSPPAPLGASGTIATGGAPATADTTAPTTSIAPADPTAPAVPATPAASAPVGATALDEPPTHTAPNAATSTIPSPPQRQRSLQLAVLSALLLAGLLIGLMPERLFHPSPPTVSAPEAPTFTPPLRSIAVLPFINMSADPTQDYFSDGLSEELINALSRIDDLQVAAQTSSFYFKGKTVDLDTVARKLNVATVLEGSVRRSGRAVRITAQLVNGLSGFRMWSQTYDRTLDDALALQSEIADAVANALKVTLLDAAAEKTGVEGTRNALALDAYLKGLKLATATLRSGEEARETISAYDEAIRLDPNFALAYAARARALLEYGSYFMIDATRAAFIQAKADADKAIALQPALGEGHAALGEVYEVGFLDFVKAADAYARAVALSPGDARVLRPYSRFAANMGHTDVAITAARRNIELDPLNVLAYRALGEALEAARQYPQAVAAFESAIKLNPSHATEAYQRRGRLYYLMGDIQKAKASCEAEPDVWHQQACMPLMYERLGQREAAQAALATAFAAQGDYASYQYAQIYAQWGNTDKALDWLDTAVRVRDPGLESMKTDAFLDPLRAQPRFQAIERALNYPP